ncbi:solute carrier family 15 member 4 isoform X3 [Hydra vulgaris]|uniref:solute carrier family 15 member 4 isoform X3 n=1 Tax=Hydra vulgaris TaxID=6087 RepID=UPI001F5FD51B|nr:solute carrier family 15 member 4 isoform X3 [Hydra vulgaris]
MQYPNESISRSTGQDEVSNDSDSDDSRCYYNRRVYLNTLNERNSIFVKVCFIFVVVLERTAYYSLSANLTFFLLEYLNYSSSLSIVTTQFFIYTTWISCIIGGVLGDFILGRFRTIIFGFFVYIIGFGMLPAINFVVNPNNVPNTNQSTQVTKNQLTVNYNSTPNIENKYIVWVFFSLFLVSIGEGCFKSNMSPFGADQINDTDDVELKKYFQYYYWALNIGAFTGYSALTLIQQEYGFIKGYPISVALLIIALIVFCIPQVKNYNAVVPARKKFLVKILKICCNSKRKADNKYSKYESYVPIQHWLDRAKEVYGGKYSESDVEDIKKLFSVLPMFFYYILYFAAFNQIISNAELVLKQLQNVHQPRRGQRRERVRSFERLQSYKEKLSSGEWTPTKFLEASAFYFNDIKLTSEGDTEQEQDENPQENVQDHQQETRPMETLCKIYLALPLEVDVLPCRHFCMCLQCSDNLENGGNKRCPICRSKIENFQNVFVS